VERNNLSSVDSRFHARGGNRKRPVAELSLDHEAGEDVAVRSNIAIIIITSS